MNKKRLLSAIFILGLFFVLSPPAKAENLRILLPLEFASLDPVEILSGDQTMVMYHVYCRLYTFDDDMNPLPDLVLSEEISDDGLNWRLTLREGVTFADGTPVNAQAVQYTIERMRDRGGSQRVLFQRISEITIEDDHTIVLTTDRPFPALRSSLAHPNAGLVSQKSDEELGDRYGVQPVSCGPYTFTEWRRGSQIVIDRNDDFYRELPEYERITFQFVPDVSTRQFMMMRGEADMALRLGPAEAEQLEANGIETVRIVGRNIFYALNYDLAPTDDIRVRKAINHAVDKETIIERVLQGAGTPARSVLEAMTWGSVPVGTYEYDPEKARALLDEANPESRRLVLLSPDNRYLLDSQTSQAVAGYLNQAGFEVDLRVIGDWAGYVDAVREKQFNLYMLGWGSSTGDPDQVLQSMFHSNRAGQAWNFKSFADTEIDAMIDEAGTTFDEDTRRTIYAEIQQRLFGDAPWLFMYRAATFTAVSDKVGDIHTLEGPEFHFVFPLPN